MVSCGSTRAPSPMSVSGPIWTSPPMTEPGAMCELDPMMQLCSTIAPELMIACALTEGRHGKLKVLYFPGDKWGELFFRLRQTLRLTPQGSYNSTREPHALVIDLPPE